jgi:glutaryl-CoA dehydrogenase
LIWGTTWLFRFSTPWNCLGAIGAAMDCYDTAPRYAKERIQFDKPIAGTQLQQKKLAEMITEITKAQLLTWRLGVLKKMRRATTAQILWPKKTMSTWH